MLNRKERASQFMPFDALKGFQEILNKTNIIRKEKKELSEDYQNDLNNIIESLKIGDTITVKYYNEIDYIETTGTLKKIDFMKKKLILYHTQIKIEDILSIDILKK